MVKSTICYVLKKKACTSHRHLRTVFKKPLLQESLFVSKSTIRRRVNIKSLQQDIKHGKPQKQENI